MLGVAVLSLVCGLALGGPTFNFLGDCGAEDAQIRFHNVRMPDVVLIGEAYNFTYDYELKQDLLSCNTVSQSLQHCPLLNYCGPVPWGPWVGGCQDDFGTCKGKTAFNICQRPGFPAYNPLYFDCQGSGNGDTALATSLPKGRYSRTQRTYFVGLNGLEQFLVEGTFKAKVEYADESGKQLGCYQYIFTTKKGTDSG